MTLYSTSLPEVARLVMPFCLRIRKTTEIAGLFLSSYQNLLSFQSRVRRPFLTWQNPDARLWPHTLKMKAHDFLGRIRLMVKRADRGFRVFKLDTSNIREWEPDRDELEESLLASIEHIKPDRSVDDILYELLLKLGLDLCVPIESRSVEGKSVHSIGAGTLMACLDEEIDAKDVEPLANGIAEWHADLDPAGDTTVVFRDGAFADDVSKTNLTAILEQRGLKNVRSL